MFQAASSAFIQPAPSPTRGSEEVGAAVGAGAAAPVTVGGGEELSRVVAQAAAERVPIVIPL
jgi:hypothetical protein